MYAACSYAKPPVFSKKYRGLPCKSDFYRQNTGAFQKRAACILRRVSLRDASELYPFSRYVQLFFPMMPSTPRLCSACIFRTPASIFGPNSLSVAGIASG